MKLINKHNKLELVIEEKLINQLVKIAIKHFPNEFGGFLIGYYSNDFKTAFVTNYLLPKKYKGFPFGFERSVDGLRKVFDKLFDEKKEYYIGEWHTHPNGSTNYSQTDLKAMFETVKCETVQITNPILLILSISKTNLTNYTFYVYDDENLISYE